MAKEIEKVRTRNWSMILYPDDPSHVDAISLLERCGYNYCAIKHDKDVWTEDDPKLGDHEPGSTKKEHWHVVVKFPQAKWNTSLAKELHIDPNYLEACETLDGSLLYLVHANAPQKYQYDASECFGKLVPALNKLLVDDDEGMRVLEIVKAIDACPGRVSYRDMLVNACQNGLYGEFRRLGSGVKWLIDEHNEDFYNECYGREKTQLEQSRFADSVQCDKNWVASCKAGLRCGNIPPME